MSNKLVEKVIDNEETVLETENGTAVEIIEKENIFKKAGNKCKETWEKIPKPVRGAILITTGAGIAVGCKMAYDAIQAANEDEIYDDDPDEAIDLEADEVTVTDL